MGSHAVHLISASDGFGRRLGSRFAIVLFVVLGAAGCGSGSSSADSARSENRNLITSRALGAEWPLWIESGRVFCDGGALFMEADNGAVYGLNAAGIRRRAKDISPIVKRDPKRGTEARPVKMSLEPIIRKAEETCGLGIPLPPLPPPPEAHELVIANASDWTVAAFGQDLIIDRLILRNENEFAISDPIVACRTTGDDGTQLSALRKELSARIESGESVTLTRVNMGFANRQSRRLACEVVGVHR